MISFLKANALNLALGVLLVGWVSIAGVTGSCPTCVIPQFVAGLFATPEAEAAEASPAPSWALEAVGGGLVSSAQLVGEVQVLTFFSRTCAPCRAELEYLGALHEEYGSKGVSFVALNVDADGDSLSEFARRRGIDFTVARGGLRLTEAFGGVSGVPTTFVLDRTGRIVSRHDGLTSKATLERAIEQAM
jgi:thiol-disulfide isomerase/thioredoxin